MSIRTISQTLLVGLLSIAALVPIVKAQNRSGTVEVDPDSETIPRKIEITDACAFPELEELPDKFLVYAAGGYRGGSSQELDFQIDQSGNNVNQSNLIVNSPSKPIVLMLGVQEPNIWNIKWTEGTEIAAVVLSGYHRQEAIGLPEETPVLITTAANGAKCGYFYLEPGDCDVLNPLSKKLFGRQVDKEYSEGKERICPMEEKEDYSSYRWIGEPREDENPQILSNNDITVNSFFDPTAPLVGMAAVEAAVEKGILRRATKADIQAWIELQQKLYSEQDTTRPAIGGEYPDGYVVIDEFTFPRHITGGDVTFLIPEDVPEPNGDPGDVTIYNFKTGKCSGLFCDF